MLGELLTHRTALCTGSGVAPDGDDRHLHPHLTPPELRPHHYARAWAARGGLRLPGGGVTFDGGCRSDGGLASPPAGSGGEDVAGAELRGTPGVGVLPQSEPQEADDGGGELAPAHA